MVFVIPCFSSSSSVCRLDVVGNWLRLAAARGCGMAGELAGRACPSLRRFCNCSDVVLGWEGQWEIG